LFSEKCNRHLSIVNEHKTRHNGQIVNNPSFIANNCFNENFVEICYGVDKTLWFGPANESSFLGYKVFSFVLETAFKQF